jgi:hypothetical protein
MRWIKWALLTISFLLPLAVADPARAVRLDRKGTLDKYMVYDVRCDNFKVKEANNYGAHRFYVFTARCKLVMTDQDLYPSVTVFGNYYEKDHETKKKGYTAERVELTFEKSQKYAIDTVLSCNFDPWLSSAAGCKVTTLKVPTPGPGLPFKAIGLEIQDSMLPFSRVGVKDVLAYIKKLTPPPAPNHREAV